MMGLLDQSPYAMMGAQPFQQHPFGLLPYQGMQGGHMGMQSPQDIQKPKGLLDYAMGLGTSPLGAAALSHYMGGGAGGGNDDLMKRLITIYGAGAGGGAAP